MDFRRRGDVHGSRINPPDSRQPDRRKRRNSTPKACTWNGGSGTGARLDPARQQGAARRVCHVRFDRDAGRECAMLGIQDGCRVDGDGDAIHGPGSEKAGSRQRIDRAVHFQLTSGGRRRSGAACLHFDVTRSHRSVGARRAMHLDARADRDGAVFGVDPRSRQYHDAPARDAPCADEAVGRKGLDKSRHLTRVRRRRDGSAGWRAGRLRDFERCCQHRAVGQTGAFDFHDRANHRGTELLLDERRCVGAHPPRCNGPIADESGSGCRLHDSVHLDHAILGHGHGCQHRACAHQHGEEPVANLILSFVSHLRPLRSDSLALVAAATGSYAAASVPVSRKDASGCICWGRMPLRRRKGRPIGGYAPWVGDLHPPQASARVRSGANRGALEWSRVGHSKYQRT